MARTGSGPPESEMTGPSRSIASSDRMAAIFSLRSTVEAMLRFEAALARAEALAGIIPHEAATAIGQSSRAESFDLEALTRDARVAGNLAIPLVRALTEQVPEQARGFVHWGATSQDAIDTGMVLQIRDGLDALLDDLLGLGTACAGLAEAHDDTPMVGRTLLQHALPITFGFKAALWLESGTGHVRRLRDLHRRLPLQLGGAVGTLASLGEHGLRVRELLGQELGLAVPALPWHTSREPLGEVALALGLLVGSSAKIATDLLLLMQSEVGEVAEAEEEGRGTSSTMPHKRNPVRAPAAIAAARRAMGTLAVVLGGMVQEHERAAGSWQAELAALSDLFRFTAGALSELRGLLENLEVRPERMRGNLEMGRGQVMAEALTMALAPHLGRDEAYRIVADVARRALRDGAELAHAAAGDERVRAVLTPEAVRAAVDPGSYLGSSRRFVRQAVDRFREVAASAPTTTAP